MEAALSIGGLGNSGIFSSPTRGVLLPLLPVTGGYVDLADSFAGTVEHASSGRNFGFYSILFEFRDLVLDTTTLKVTAGLVGLARAGRRRMAQPDAGLSP